MIITATRFHLNSWFSYLKFLVVTYRVVLQARESTGQIYMKVHPIRLRGLTAWKSRENMVAFRNNGAHLEAMKQSAQFGNIFSYTWEADALPSWKASIATFEDNVD